MGLREVMAQIVAIEEGLSIAAPTAISDVRAYKVAPGRKVVPTNKVTFMNWPDVASEARMGNKREDAITVQIDCLIKESNLEQGADIALAFFDAAWDAFDAERAVSARLGGTVDYLTLKAVRPMIETIDWAGQGFAGFHIFLDLVLFKDVS